MSDTALEYSERFGIWMSAEFLSKLGKIQADVDLALLSGRTTPIHPKPVIDLNIPLNPCPFCGGSDVKPGDRVSYGHGDCTCEVFVECMSCHAKGPDCGYWGQPTDEQRLKAIEAWNKPF